MTKENYETNLANIKRCLEVLRRFKESNECPETLKGTIGNLIGQVRPVEKFMENPPALSQTAQIINEYNTDPVIKAYIDQRDGWMSKLHRMKSKIHSCFDWDGDDD